jgi:hypothetical protein
MELILVQNQLIIPSVHDRISGLIKLRKELMVCIYISADKELKLQVNMNFWSTVETANGQPIRLK